MRWAHRWAGAAAFALLATGPAGAGEPGLEEAWATFQRICRPCHGSLGDGDGPYAHAFARPAGSLLRAAPPAERHQWIARSRPGSPMPAFGERLDDRRIRALVLLLEDLGRERAGDAPAAAFAARCAACHGENGHGDGPLAGELIPRPRDLTRPWYRFRSTPSGGPPLAADLVRTLEHGLGVTAMGSFAALGRSRLEGLAGHLLELAPASAGAAAPAPAGEGAPPAAAAVERGRALYDEARCWQCHGEDGRGDGPTARELRDDAGDASLPANLTKRWQLKGGETVADLMRAIANGLNGTPMPSYAEALAPDDIRALAAYVRELGRPRPGVPGRAPVRRLAGAPPRDPDDPRWISLPTVAVPLGPQMFAAPEWSRPAVDLVEVAVAAVGEGLAFYLAWDDRFEDRSRDDAGQAGASALDDAARAGRWRLPDGLALQLAAPAADGSLPPLYLGAADRPVERWVWSADGDAVRVEERRGPGGGRVLSSGPTAVARFAKGRWRLVLSDLGRAAGGRLDASGGSALALAIHAWDGSQGEHGSRHGVSSWVRLTPPGS